MGEHGERLTHHLECEPASAISAAASALLANQAPNEPWGRRIQLALDRRWRCTTTQTEQVASGEPAEGGPVAADAGRTLHTEKSAGFCSCAMEIRLIQGGPASG